jgi:type II secretory pathway component GspD/PulD (secretin)
MLEVLMIALNDSDLLDFGVELQSITISGSTVISLSSLFGLSTRTGGEPAVDSSAQGFTGIVLSPGDFSVVIRALQTLNQGRSLVMPKVLVNNNQEASLDSVLQQPFQSTNASTTVATTSFGGTQDAGTTVTVKPSIAEGDHLVLEYTVTRSAFVGESTDPSLPPPRQQNSFQSMVTIPDNYTVVVGGLQNEEETEAVSQVPFIGDIPLIGEVFKNRSKSFSRTYFYVFIRPTILRNDRFDDLRYRSDRDLARMRLDDGWPDLEPEVIR